MRLRKNTMLTKVHIPQLRRNTNMMTRVHIPQFPHIIQGNS
uniref:Uncharacterized protein n=1 Tax=Rhizophora mucronata TaxID=61149 RepID=A0A2P2QV42_RHIMU